MYAAVFLTIVVFSPLALVSAVLRPMPSAIGTGLAPATTLGSAPVILAALAFIAVALLGALICDLCMLLKIKARSRIARRSVRQARRAKVACSSDVRTPTAIGYFHPRIVVPLDLAERISDDEWSAIVAHENAHLVRYDDWAKAIQSALVRLMWFSPALWWLGGRLDLERELASDESATTDRDPRAYAACLVRLAADVRPLPAPAAWTARSQVAIRVEQLVRRRARRPLAATAASGGLGIGIALVLAFAFDLEPGTSRGPAPLHAVAAANIPAPAPLAMAPVGPQVIGSTLAHRSARESQPGIHASAERPAGVAARKAAAGVQVAAVLPAGPCRTCELLRRPVADGPSLPRHRRTLGAPSIVIVPAPAAQATSAPLPMPVRAVVGAPASHPTSFLPSVEPEEQPSSEPSGPFVFVPGGH